jgi:hypothetical protein
MDESGNGETQESPPVGRAQKSNVPPADTQHFSPRSSTPFRRGLIFGLLFSVPWLLALVLFGWKGAAVALVIELIAARLLRPWGKRRWSTRQ